MKQHIVRNIKAIILAAALVGGAGYAAAETIGTWNPAPGTPPQYNTATPLNVGTADQEKTGSLRAGHLRTNDLIIGNGEGSVDLTNPVKPIVAGQVLTSYDTTGTAVWRDLPAVANQFVPVSDQPVVAWYYVTSVDHKGEILGAKQSGEGMTTAAPINTYATTNLNSLTGGKAASVVFLKVTCGESYVAISNQRLFNLIPTTYNTKSDWMTNYDPEYVCKAGNNQWQTEDVVAFPDSSGNISWKIIRTDGNSINETYYASMVLTGYK